MHISLFSAPVLQTSTELSSLQLSRSERNFVLTVPELDLQSGGACISFLSLGRKLPQMWQLKQHKFRTSRFCKSGTAWLALCSGCDMVDIQVLAWLGSCLEALGRKSTSKLILIVGKIQFFASCRTGVPISWLVLNGGPCPALRNTSLFLSALTFFLTIF